MNFKRIAYYLRRFPRMFVTSTIRNISEGLRMYRDYGLLELMFGIKRFFQYRFVYMIYLVTGLPRAVTIDGVSREFFVTNTTEFDRTRTLSGEREVLRFFLDNVKQDDVMWDIGANVGIYSVFLAPFVTQMVSFEPHPMNAGRLLENAELNDVAIDLRLYALSNQTGVYKFTYDVTTGHGGDKLSPNGEIEVAIRRAKTIDPLPDIVKIDLEGHELAVLEGFEDILSKVRFVVVESHSADNLPTIIEIFDQAGLTTDTPFRSGGSREFVLGYNKSSPDQ